MYPEEAFERDKQIFPTAENKTVIKRQTKMLRTQMLKKGSAVLEQDDLAKLF